MNVAEVVSDGGEQLLLFEQAQQPEPCVVHIMATQRSRRVAAGDNVYTA
jgi:hypothetical protein